jgi:hypothetical protein
VFWVWWDRAHLGGLVVLRTDLLSIYVVDFGCCRVDM